MWGRKSTAWLLDQSPGSCLDFSNYLIQIVFLSPQVLGHNREQRYVLVDHQNSHFSINPGEH